MPHPGHGRLVTTHVTEQQRNTLTA